MTSTGYLCVLRERIRKKDGPGSSHEFAVELEKTMTNLIDLQEAEERPEEKLQTRLPLGKVDA